MFENNINSNLSNIEQHISELKKQIELWNKKATFIQSQFDFIIPNYIIDEIISNEYSKNYSNLHYLINAAVVNKRLTKNNGNILKELY
ncbi:MAG: hypothetical protein V8R82_09395 [Clostridia bacterium]